MKVTKKSLSRTAIGIYRPEVGAVVLDDSSLFHRNCQSPVLGIISTVVTLDDRSRFSTGRLASQVRAVLVL